MTDWRYLETFRAVDPAEWIRILPIGSFKRFGRQVEVTREMLEEMAANFGTVPSTRLPVNREHVEHEGKVGDIVAVEVRDDGLYARFEWTEKGRQYLEDNAFQYFSPEVVWGPTDYEGREVSNVLVGIALTNSPWFGEHTALFSINDLGATTPPGAHGEVDSDRINEEDSMADTDKQAVKGAVREFFQELFGSPKPEPQPAPHVATIKVEETEEYKALQARLEKAEQEREKAERAQAFADRVEKFRAIVGDELKIGEKNGADLFATIAETHPEEAQALAEQVKALYAQVTEGVLLAELGTSTPEDTADPKAKFAALVEKAKQDGKDEADAIEAVGREHPDLYRAYIQA